MWKNSRRRLERLDRNQHLKRILPTRVVLHSPKEFWMQNLLLLRLLRKVM
jgi:hypothetical protein